MDILFIRHGETDWNREMRIQDGIVEIDINARGVRQAELLRPSRQMCNRPTLARRPKSHLL